MSTAERNMQSYRGHSLTSASRDIGDHYTLSSSESGSNRYTRDQRHDIGGVFIPRGWQTQAAPDAADAAQSRQVGISQPRYVAQVPHPPHDGDYNDDRQHGSHDGADRHGGHSSSNRWVPRPQGRLCLPPPPVDGVCDNDQSVRNQKQHVTNSGEQGGVRGRSGGGKIVRQRRHNFSDAQNQRNQYRASHPQQRRNIITPDAKESLAFSHQQQQQQQQSTYSNPAPVTTTATAATNPATNADVPKLDPADPASAKRILQRRRQVLFGKNTAGYEEYTKKIPRHTRKPRSLDCPMTPDHMLDIPTKRWQGLMNAWRRALHKYDPLDLHLRQPSQNTIKLAPRPCVTEGDVQAEEIAQAKATGLQVAFTSMKVGNLASMFSTNVAADEGMSNDDAWGVAEREGGGWAMGTSGPKTEEMPLFDEEAAYQQTMEGGIGFEECDSDSDNDLL